MIAIKDMEEMPNCCLWDCPLAREDGGACMLGAYDPKTDTKKERAKDCPLTEIVTCKDCKHYENILTAVLKDGSEVILHVCKKYKIGISEDFYCKDGERR